jgi:D-alanine-D-alanine ligase-like ATP-grasp enzyme
MLTHFRPRIRSRHPSHNPLRHQNNNLPMMPFRSRIRLGSTTPLRRPDRFPVVELNTIEAIRNSSSKLRMKTCFTNHEVKTADWWNIQNGDFVNMHDPEKDIVTSKEDLPFPIVAKAHFGSRGRGNTKLDSVEALTEWMEGKDLSRYIFEKYYSYNREYRLHVDEEGCFYACRKMLKSDAPQEVRWYRNDDHCVWIMEENELFDKPSNWNQLVSESVKALKAVGLDFGAIDLRIQSATMSDGETPRENPEFIVVEINSAPSFGEKTTEVYLTELPRILRNKYNKSN